MSAMQGKAQQHCLGTGSEGRDCGSQGWRHGSAPLWGPWAEQGTPGPRCWRRGLVCSRGGTTSLLTPSTTSVMGITRGTVAK